MKEEDRRDLELKILFWLAVLLIVGGLAVIIGLNQ